MDHLRRSLAPVPDAAWAQIEEEAQRTLRLTLGLRRLVDVTGPVGWDVDAVTTGVVDDLADVVGDGVTGGVRRPQPFVELRATFDLAQADVDAAERGNPAIDTSSVIAACRRIATAEDGLVLHGLASAATAGIVGSSPHAVLHAGPEPTSYLAQVAQALQVLRDSGVNGPYAVVVGDAVYTALATSTEHGYPLSQHLSSVLDGGDVVWSAALTGAVVLTRRGGDYELTLGEDLSLGYSGWGDGRVGLYVEESVAFRVLTPEAAVVIAAE